MTRSEKEQLIEGLTQKLSETDFFYIADASGLTVAEINDFRRLCFQNGIEYRVVKNTMIRKALENLDTDYSSFDDVLKGFSGILLSPASGNAPAKVIKDFRKKGGDGSKPLFKAASIDSDLFIGEHKLEMLSSLKSKNELIGEIITLLQSPAKNVISALSSGENKLAGIVKTLSERES